MKTFKGETREQLLARLWGTDMSSSTRPPSSTGGTIWTHKQQQQLDELLRQKKQALDDNMPQLVEVVLTVVSDVPKSSTTSEPFDGLAAALAKNATAMRQALRPFDLEASK